MDVYQKLAKQALSEYLKKGKIISQPIDLPTALLEQQSGVFVSFKKFDELRGCIGTFLPTRKNIALEIINNSISAATQDPRFTPIELNEIDDLEISVDILSQPVIATKNELDPHQYGVIVKTIDGRVGLLLPDLDGVDTVNQQLKIACQKGGIDYESDDYQILKFTVERHGSK